MDNHSFSAVLSITENRSRILAFIMGMVRDFDTAEDLFQETVIQILKSEQQFDPTRTFMPWACGIAKYVVLQHWKNQQRTPSSGLCDIIANLAMITTQGDDELWVKERKALRTCLLRLPDKMQRLLLLRYGHNIKGRELADSAAIRLGSIRTTLSRLRSQLRQCIKAKTTHAS